MNEEKKVEKKESEFGWKEGFVMFVVTLLLFTILLSGWWAISSIYSIGTCQQLQTANTAPGFQYGYNVWTGCRVHIPSGLWAPQSDLDKYLAPDPAVHLPKEFLK